MTDDPEDAPDPEGSTSISTFDDYDPTPKQLIGEILLWFICAVGLGMGFAILLGVVQL